MSDHGHGKPVDFQSEQRVFEYSVDNGATWLLCISTLRDDDVRQVQTDLSARYGFPVVVREKMPRLASVSTAARCRSSKAADSLVSAHTARPGNTRKRQSKGEEHAASEDFDDEIPF